MYPSCAAQPSTQVLMLHKLATMPLSSQKPASAVRFWTGEKHSHLLPRSPYPDYALNTAQAND